MHSYFDYGHFPLFVVMNDSSPLFIYYKRKKGKKREREREKEQKEKAYYRFFFFLVNLS